MSHPRPRVKARRPIPMVFAALLLPVMALALLLGTSIVKADLTELAPNAQRAPQDVVQIVIDSLASNAQLENDAGIATVFRFASPGNRAATGPLERFTAMIKTGFPDMLDHDGARFDPMEVNGDTAIQVVWLLAPSGKEMGYAFQLTRQPAGEYEDMWLTDAVVPLGPGPASGTRI